MPQAFAGVRVIDFSQVYAGPFAAQQLATLGADVIKVEPVATRDMTRTLGGSPCGAVGMAPPYLTCNLGKRAISVDLKHAAARTIVQALVASADVVLENFTAGVMDRLGFGYDALRAIRPDLIYCAITGYGQAGPMAGAAAFDGAIQAASGMMAITGFPETGPTRTGFMPADMGTAMNAAFAIAAALFRRARTGEGQFLDVAMMDTAMLLQAAQVSTYLVDGTVPPLQGNRSPTGQPTANVLPTRDGYLQLIALNDKQVSGMADALERPDILADPRFATPAARARHYDELTDLLRRTLALRTTAEWVARLRAAGVPCAEIREYPAVAHDPQFAYRNVFTAIPSPLDPAATVHVVGAGHVANADGPGTHRPPPQHSEHTDEVLAELGFSARQIAAWRADGAI